jgi:hypothetical protein
MRDEKPAATSGGRVEVLMRGLRWDCICNLTVPCRAGSVEVVVVDGPA